jgi:hypothetical protein
VAGGGTDLAANTWAEIAVSLVGAGLAITAVLVSAPGRAWGAGSLLLLAALTVFTAASIAWSVQPADSWVEANRAVSYLAAFGGAMALARIAPGRWRALVGAIAVLATVVCGYSLLAKVFPATLDPGDLVGRLRLPFDYWNAVGLMADMGIPAWLWVGSRREASRSSRMLAAPALGILATAMLLSLSRGALAIVALGLVLWFALVPVRLRAAALLVLAAVVAGAASAWALSNRALIHDRVAMHARTVAGHRFGLVLIAMLALLTVAGVVATYAIDRTAISTLTRRRLGMGLIMLAALVPVGGVAAVAHSSRGLSGTISHAWNQLTSPDSGGAAPVPGRLVSLGSTRGRYWNEGLRVGEHALLKGAGAGGFATATTHYTPNPTNSFVAHAHSYLIETFADLGLIGVALSLALLVAWALAAGRSIGTSGGRSPELGAERSGLITLLVIVVVFGLNSAIDWTWFIPGTALTALVCAGWLAGRGPPAAPVSRRPLSVTPARIGAVTVVAVVTLLTAWLVYQPLRSATAESAALKSITEGNIGKALADARAAANSDPVSVDPLFDLATFYRASGDDSAALTQFQKAVSLQPKNPETWFEEGRFLLTEHRTSAALAALHRALDLDRGSFLIRGVIQRAEAQLLRSGGE